MGGDLDGDTHRDAFIFLRDFVHDKSEYVRDLRDFLKLAFNGRDQSKQFEFDHQLLKQNWKGNPFCFLHPSTYCTITIELL